MTEDQIRASLSPVQTVACTMMAEAAGDLKEGNSSVEERLAVACVIRNRVRRPRWWGTDYKSVCLKPKMFSCWNIGTDANHMRLIALAEAMVSGSSFNNTMAGESLALAQLVIENVILDTTKGADHYFAPAAMHGEYPSWAKGQTGMRPPLVIVGRQYFYKLEE